MTDQMSRRAALAGIATIAPAVSAGVVLAAPAVAMGNAPLLAARAKFQEWDARLDARLLLSQAELDAMTREEYEAAWRSRSDALPGRCEAWTREG